MGSDQEEFGLKRASKLCLATKVLFGWDGGLKMVPKVLVGLTGVVYGVG